MSKVRRVLFFVLFVFVFPYVSFAIDKTRCTLINNQIDLELKRNSRYLWASNSMKLGDPADCSSVVARIIINSDADAIVKKLRISGIGVRRSNTARMMQGLDGFRGIFVNFDDSEPCDIPFFLFKVRHTGLFRIKTENNKNMLAHQSSTYGFIQVPVYKKYNDPFYSHLIKILRLE